MKIELVKDPCIHLILHDVFNESELLEIWQELEFLNNPLRFQRPDSTGSYSKNAKSNSGIFLQDIYTDYKFSSIATLSHNKFHGSSITETLIKEDPIQNYYSMLNDCGILVSYYENSDYYEPHSDAAIYTICNWFYKEPKAFEGGNFRIYYKDQIKEYEVKNNMAILLPSSIKHEVTPVKLKTVGKGLGRYTISHFLTIRF